MNLALWHCCFVDDCRGQVPPAGTFPYREEPVNYFSDDLADPVSRLREKVLQGDIRLVFESNTGHLRSLLAGFDGQFRKRVAIAFDASDVRPAISYAVAAGTGAAAAPVAQPESAARPLALVTSVNVPSPLFRYSTTPPKQVTSRSGQPSLL